MFLITWYCWPLVTGSRKSKLGGAAGDDDDEEEEDEGIGGEELRASDIVRKEMGLEWMLKSASSGRAESSQARGADKDEEEVAPEEVMITTSHVRYAYGSMLVS